MISDQDEAFIRNEIRKYFSLKESSISTPTQYLGGKLRMVELENGHKCWPFGLRKYVEESVQNILKYIKKRGEGLSEKSVTPTNNGYCPEIDITPECGPEDAAYFHSLIGILRGVVEIGRIDINV